MRVRSKDDNREYEATKKDDGSYAVQGVVYTREEMAEKFIPIKEVKKIENVQSEPQIISGETEIGGDIGGLAGALAKCQGEFTAVHKGTSAHNYSYADIAAVLLSSSKITSKHGIAVTQVNLSKIVDNVLLTGVKTILMHESGGYITGEVFMPTEKTKMNSLVQMFGVNCTYMRRYGLQSALGLATTDNDGSDK